MHFWGLVFLAWEMSTIFMNLRWLLIQLGRTSSFFFSFIEVSFAVSFLFVRNVIGILSSYYVWIDMMPLSMGIPYILDSKYCVPIDLD